MVIISANFTNGIERLQLLIFQIKNKINVCLPLQSLCSGIHFASEFSQLWRSFQQILGNFESIKPYFFLKSLSDIAIGTFFNYMVNYIVPNLTIHS